MDALVYNQRRGYSRKQIRFIQETLGLAVDGIWREDMIVAVERFKSQQGLPADGKVDSETLLRMETLAGRRGFDVGLSEEVFVGELEEIDARRQAAGLPAAGGKGPPRAHRGLVGLALSGGGIRSATFGLGVVQALARFGVFSRIDYLSTVSGGGFTGS
ncbi:MAG: peptidoglycan-binding protein, partial [Myxococcales bacterium]|nr:peptidoglycan-binding protein [Myxococcales bacterium]